MDNINGKENQTDDFNPRYSESGGHAFHFTDGEDSDGSTTTSTSNSSKYIFNEQDIRGISETQIPTTTEQIPSLIKQALLSSRTNTGAETVSFKPPDFSEGKTNSFRTGTFTHPINKAPWYAYECGRDIEERRDNGGKDDPPLKAQPRTKFDAYKGVPMVPANTPNRIYLDEKKLVLAQMDPYRGANMFWNLRGFARNWWNNSTLRSFVGWIRSNIV